MSRKQAGNQGEKEKKMSFWEVIRKASREAKSTEGGILKIADYDSSGSWKTIQDAHNANHVLTHLYFMMFRVFINKSSNNGKECRERIIAHLACLREFIAQDDNELRIATEELLQGMKKRPLETLEDWADFILTHWTQIRTMTVRYSSPEKCFSAGDHEKLERFLKEKRG